MSDWQYAGRTPDSPVVRSSARSSFTRSDISLNAAAAAANHLNSEDEEVTVFLCRMSSDISYVI